MRKAQTPDGPPTLEQLKKQERREQTEREARQFIAMCEGAGLRTPMREHVFRDGRGSAFDFAWPDYRVALEVEGGIFARQGHGSMVRIAMDMEKYNAAAERGWLVLRCVPGPKDITRWRTSKRTGGRTPTPIYSVPGLCTFTTMRMIENAMSINGRADA